MLGKFITFIFIPEKTGAIKRLKVSFRSLLLVSFLLVLLFSLWGWVVYDYVSIRTGLIDLEENQKHYDEAESRIKEFDQRYAATQVYFDHLNGLYLKLKRLTSQTFESKPSLELDEKTQASTLAKAKEKGILEVISSDLSEADQDKKAIETRFLQLMDFFKETSNPMKRVPQGWPVRGYVTNEFGMLHDAFTGQARPQHGVIIATKALTFLTAPADGIVQYAGEDEYFGELIVMDHANGIQTRYGFVSNLQIEPGQVVRRGQEMGQILNTPRTTGPQLYYEVTFNAVPQNPIKYINPLQLVD